MIEKFSIFKVKDDFTTRADAFVKALRALELKYQVQIKLTDNELHIEEIIGKTGEYR